jgi:hypothetical protein
LAQRVDVLGLEREVAEVTSPGVGRILLIDLPEDYG